MKTNIVRIGNSKGIRLPKSVLQQCHLEDTVDMEVEDDVLIIRSVRAPRRGWADAFAVMSSRKDDKLLDTDTALATKWDRTEWRW